MVVPPAIALTKASVLSLNNLNACYSYLSQEFKNFKLPFTIRCHLDLGLFCFLFVHPRNQVDSLSQVFEAQL